MHLFTDVLLIALCGALTHAHDGLFISTIIDAHQQLCAACKSRSDSDHNANQLWPIYKKFKKSKSHFWSQLWKQYVISSLLPSVKIFILITSVKYVSRVTLLFS